MLRVTYGNLEHIKYLAARYIIKKRSYNITQYMNLLHKETKKKKVQLTP